ncbi:hypothetical protein [Agrobacterium vitis]|uniref:hypothetical protein n=1 Tax=Agrobacterium vitis TaxID=373 RepID=UPI0012E84353|nr:hypothetical protein [Agrobacterium vitis]MVA36116.1 hypothetical protein [Agrobacterium vitis]
MSAFYAFIDQDSVNIFTDGVIYTDDGTIEALAEKVHRSDHVPLAVAGRGPSDLVRLLAKLICAISVCGSVDDTISAFREKMAARKDLEASGFFDLVIGCISETGGPKLYYLTNYTQFGDMAPFDLREVGPDLCGGPNPDDETMSVFLPQEFVEVASTIEIVINFFQAMRVTKKPSLTHPDKIEIYGVGGHVDFTKVSASAATTTRVHEWPDRVGEKIDPYRELNDALGSLVAAE